jgi:hypothetical protein
MNTNPPSDTGSGAAVAPAASPELNPNFRFITSHKEHPGDTELNQNLNIAVLDGPGPGNACHEYEISAVGDNSQFPPVRIRFQRGPIKEIGLVNGLSQEVLTAILIDRLEGFQSGPYACDDNSEALKAYRVALAALQRRTRERQARGVEGTNQV